MAKLPPPSLPPEPPSGVTRTMIELALSELYIASAARIGNFLGYVGPDQIAEIFAELENMAAAGDVSQNWINHQALFCLPEEA